MRSRARKKKKVAISASYLLFFLPLSLDNIRYNGYGNQRKGKFRIIIKLMPVKKLLNWINLEMKLYFMIFNCKWKSNESHFYAGGEEGNFFFENYA